MTDNELKTISEKIDSLHKKILESKFAEKVTESEMYSVILAVQELNRQKAEIDRYKGVIKILEKDVAAAQNEGAKDFGKYLIDKCVKGMITAGDIVDYCYEFTHEVTKIEQVEAGD